MVAQSLVFHRHCEPVTDVIWRGNPFSFGKRSVNQHCTGGADCHVARVLLAMTSKDRRHYRDLSTRTPRALPAAMLKPRLRGAARRAHGSSAEHAMRDLIASNAPLRGGRHKARPASSKTLPQGIQGDRKQGPRQSPTKWVWWGEEEQWND